MSATLGLDRLPRPIATLLEESAGNLVTVANELDELVHGDTSALDAIARSEDNGDRIVHDLISATGHSRRLGPDRTRLIVLAQAVDDVVDALDEVGRSWSSSPQPKLTELVLALRDTVRNAGRAIAAIEDEAELRVSLSRCREREREVRHHSRAARAWLLVEQPDPQLAIRGHNLLRHADTALRACAQLRIRLATNALA